MKLCLGTVQFGTDYGIQRAGRPTSDNVDKILSYAIEHGVNCFDTASAYGDAENIIGRYIKNCSYAAEKMNIVSKLSSTALKNIPHFEWENIIKQNAEMSIKTLGVSKLKAYLFHNAALIHSQEAVKALAAVCREGMAEKVGVSIYSPDEALKALEYDEIGVIQIPYNVFDQRLDKCGFFIKAKKKGIEIYARSTLLQGLVTMSPNKLPKNMKFAEKYLRRLLYFCGKYNVSPLKAAIGYVQLHSDIDYLVFGVDDIQQLIEYISINKYGIPQEMAEDLRREFEVVEEKLVNPVLWS